MRLDTALQPHLCFFRGSSTNLSEGNLNLELCDVEFPDRLLQEFTRRAEYNYTFT